MSVTGDIVEVRVQSRGSQLVGDHTSGASSIVVANPTDFDTAGGMLRIDGTVYTWTSVTPNGTDDEATATLAITPNLAANEPDTMPVELWSGAQVIDDVVLTVDAGGDTPAYVSLRSDQRKDWTALEGYLEPPVPATFSNDFSVLLDADGYTPTLDAATLTGDLPDAPTVAVTAPTSSPTFEVRGFASGLQILTAPVPASTLLDVYVDGVLVAADQRSNYIAVTTNAAGQQMAADVIDTTYAVTVVAHNAAGSAAASGPVTGSRDLGYPDTSWFYAVLADTIRTRVLEALSVKGAEGSFDSITVARLTINGLLNYVQGALVLANGISDPVDKPSVIPAGWDTFDVAVTEDAGTYRGLYSDTSDWVTTCTVPYGNSVTSYSKTTGAVTVGTFLPGGFRPVGGVTRLSTTWYVLGFDDNRLAWYVFTFNSSWVKNGEWAVPVNLPNGGAIGNDGSSILIGKTDASNIARITAHNASTGALGETVTGAGSLTGQVTAIIKSSAGLGATRFVLATSSEIRVYSSAGSGDRTVSRVTAEEWTVANTAVRGLAHDGTNWRSFNGVRISKYENLTGIWDFRYSDANPGSSYETGPSDLRTVTLARQKWTLGGTPPVAAGITAVRVYAAPTGSPLIRQATITASPWSQTFSSFLLSGTTTTTNNFPTGNAGSIRSTGTDGTNPLTQFDGSGKVARAAKLIQSGTKSVSVTTGGTAASASVTFPVAFETAPTVTVAADTASPGTTMASKQNVTTTGFTVWAVRSSTGTVNVDWIATTGV